MPNTLISPTSTHRYGILNRLPGIYAGVVDYNIDPLKQGRIKVRVPELHGSEKSLDVDELPWCELMHSHGGLHDTGSFVVPEVGSSVWVGFINGDPQFPICLGVFHKTPKETREVITRTSKETGIEWPPRPVSIGKWMQPRGPETPSEVLSSPYNPSVQVLLKSVKGHTIYTEDRDGFEKLVIVDRVGQQVIFESEVKDEKNQKNAKQRKNGEASKKETVKYEDLTGATSSVRVLAKNGQGVNIVSSKGNEYIELISNKEKDPSQKTVADSVRIFMGSGTGNFEITGVSEGKEVCRFSFDTATGSFVLNGGLSLSIKVDAVSVVAESISLSGDVNIGGSVTVGGDMVLGGDLVGGGI